MAVAQVSTCNALDSDRPNVRQRKGITGSVSILSTCYGDPVQVASYKPIVCLSHLPLLNVCFAGSLSRGVHELTPPLVVRRPIALPSSKHTATQLAGLTIGGLACPAHAAQRRHVAGRS